MPIPSILHYNFYQKSKMTKCILGPTIHKPYSYITRSVRHGYCPSVRHSHHMRILRRFSPKSSD